MYAIQTHWGQYVSTCWKFGYGLDFTSSWLFQGNVMKFLTKESAQSQLDKWESEDIDIVGDFEVVSIGEDN